MRAVLQIALFTFLVSLTGCSSIGKAWKSLVSGKPADQAQPAAQAAQAGARNKPGLRYSQYKEIPVEEGQRQFRRTTRDTFEEAARLEESAGSLWVMEGQGSYLFSQNVLRLSGDSLKVRLEGEPKKNLEAKVEVIKRLIKKAKRDESRRGVASAGAAGEKKPDGAPAAAADGKPAADGAAKTAAAKAADKEDEKEDLEGAFSVTTVPTRIMERLPDGSYRVRGSQSFMVGKNEYRVIVVGVARAKDISEEGVDSSALLDSKFDIVSVKKDLKL